MKKVFIGIGGVILLVFIALFVATRPNLEDDGSYSPSTLALSLSTAPVTDYQEVSYTKYQGTKSKILVIFTERKNLEMENGKMFSTGNHPVEALVPMLHLQSAGFDFEIATPTGKPVVFEMWAFPYGDENVKALYDKYRSAFEEPKKLEEFINNSFSDTDSYAGVFVPGGHGSMIGIPKDRNVGKILNWAHQSNLYTITLCHGPGSLFSTTMENEDFIYRGYKMAVFPDAVDEMTPMVGYLPGKMKFGVSERLKVLGAEVVNTESDNTVCVDRKLITGASPLASNELGKLAANTLLEGLN
ncbi:protein deglycase HchA [Flavobacteriales bacterium]|nr:protein deglycase HchA [Flavobacteriales bacterium]